MYRSRLRLLVKQVLDRVRFLVVYDLWCGLRLRLGLRLRWWALDTEAMKSVPLPLRSDNPEIVRPHPPGQNIDKVLIAEISLVVPVKQPEKHQNEPIFDLVG